MKKIKKRKVSAFVIKFNPAIEDRIYFLTQLGDFKRAILELRNEKTSMEGKRELAQTIRVSTANKAKKKLTLLV